MKLLFALTYYHPHISGLTVYLQRLAEALAARGHSVTVLTSQHRRELAREEILNGVRVVRVPAGWRVSKGLLMPTYPRFVPELLRAHDAVMLNLPCTPVEATVLPLAARYLIRRPIVATYYCDVLLPRGRFNRIVGEAVFLSNLAAGRVVERIISLTDDYARHSRFLRRFPAKYQSIAPAVNIGVPDGEAVREFRRRHAPQGERLIGLAARFASEKGVEYLLDALPSITEKLGGVKLLLTGDPQSVVGEADYWRQMQPRLARAAGQCVFLGSLAWAEMPVFYAACDVTVLPSVNETESFGLVQLESMLCGTPVVASNLAGVRVPVETTRMGRLVPPRDTTALAEAVVEVIENRQMYVRTRAEIERHFSFARTVRAYEEMFERLIRDR